MEISLATIWEAIDKGGVVALSVLIVVAFLRGWLVPRWAYDAVVKDMEFFRHAAIRGTDLADRATRVAETKVADRVD